MNVFEMVVVIVVLSFLYKLARAWLAAGAQRPKDEPDRAALLARLDQLEERVQVLERIVTDERYDLKRQFKDLAG